jgi:hypothetical protein
VCAQTDTAQVALVQFDRQRTRAQHRRRGDLADAPNVRR